MKDAHSTLAHKRIKLMQIFDQVDRTCLILKWKPRVPLMNILVCNQSYNSAFFSTYVKSCQYFINNGLSCLIIRKDGKDIEVTLSG